MKKTISIFFILALALGIVGSVRAETSHGSGAGITQGTADGLYGSLAGEAGWGGTQDHSLAILIAKAFTADTHVATRIAGDGRWPQLIAATNTFTGTHLAPDGTAALPAYAYSGEPGTGFSLHPGGARIVGSILGASFITFDATTGINTSGNTVFGDAVGDTTIFNGGTITFAADPTIINFDGDTRLDATGVELLFDAGTLQVEGVEGWAYNPGSDIDTDLIMVEVTGNPKGIWDESEGMFAWTKGHLFPNVGIGGTPNSETLFLAVSTTQASIPFPLMTEAQRNAITEEEGHWVHNTDTGTPNFRNASEWRAPVSTSAASLTAGCVPFADSANSLDDDAALFWDNTNKRLGIGTNTPDATLDVEGGAIAVSEIAAPATPASGKFLLYAKTDGKIYSKNDAGTEVDLVGPTVKAGLKTSGSFAGNPQTVTVTFSTAFPDANYSVSISGTDVRDWSVDSQVAGSFVINANAAQALSDSAYWAAIAHYDP